MPRCVSWRWNAVPTTHGKVCHLGHITQIRADNAIERLNRGIRRRTRVVGAFPDGRSALMLVTVRLKYIVENERGRRRYLDVSLLEEKEGGM